MGALPADIHPNPLATFGFGIKADGKPWGKGLRAVLALFWRVIYRHMTALEEDKTPFHEPSVCKDLARMIMRMILNYQIEKRTFCLSRKFSKKTSVLPSKVASQVAHLGDLDCRTGKLTLHKGLSDILSEYNMMTNFN